MALAVPAVPARSRPSSYGHGLDPRHISLSAREFAHAMKGGANTLLTVGLESGAELALSKAIQRDPIRGTVEHSTCCWYAAASG